MSSQSNTWMLALCSCWWRFVHVSVFFSSPPQEIVICWIGWFLHKFQADANPKPYESDCPRDVATINIILMLQFCAAVLNPMRIFATLQITCVFPRWCFCCSNLTVWYFLFLFFNEIYCQKQNLIRHVYLISKYWHQASRGFEPRSLDSGSRVPTVTPWIQLAYFQKLGLCQNQV